MVVAASHVPLYVQIEQDLRHSIDLGRLAPLDRVPSESELSERFGVSRMTARKGLDQLVSQGILFRQPGKGTFVAAGKIEHDPTSRNSFSASLAALGFTVTTRVLAARMVRGTAHVTEGLALPRRSKVVFIRRLRLLDAEPAAIHDVYLPPRLADLLHERLEGSLIRLLAQKNAVGTVGRDTIDVTPATDTIAKHLDIESGAPVLHKIGTVLSDSLDPVRYSEAYYRADRFKFITDTAERRLEAQAIPKT